MSPRFDDIPMPDVTEGNDDSDWELWEDSVAEMDSQIQALGERGGDDGPTDSWNENHDPFANVRNNRDW